MPLAKYLLLAFENKRVVCCHMVSPDFIPLKPILQISICLTSYFIWNQLGIQIVII
jgi:hypothetical protein